VKVGVRLIPILYACFVFVVAMIVEMR